MAFSSNDAINMLIQPFFVSYYNFKQTVISDICNIWHSYINCKINMSIYDEDFLLEHEATSTKVSEQILKL